jgi:hypothetical protein
VSDLWDRLNALLDAEPIECAGTGEYSKCGDLSDRHEAMVTGLRAVVNLHYDGNGGLYPNSGGFCATCEDSEGLSGMPWPCPTLTAIAAIWKDEK